MNTYQIVAKAEMEIRNQFPFALIPFDGRVAAIIQSAIEEADKHGYQRGVRDCSTAGEEAHKQGMKQGWNEGREHERPAHASEQEEHKMAIEFSEFVWFSTLVEPYVANQYCHKKDDLSRKLYDACVKIRPSIDRYRANIPPAHASETYDTATKEDGCLRAWPVKKPAHASEGWIQKLKRILDDLPPKWKQLHAKDK